MSLKQKITFIVEHCLKRMSLEILTDELPKHLMSTLEEHGAVVRKDCKVCIIELTSKASQESFREFLEASDEVDPVVVDQSSKNIIPLISEEERKLAKEAQFFTMHAENKQQNDLPSLHSKCPVFPGGSMTDFENDGWTYE